MATQAMIQAKIRKTEQQIDFFQKHGCNPVRSIQALAYFQKQLAEQKATDRAIEIDRAKAARDAQRKAHGVSARFECNGKDRHSACGTKCRLAQRLNGIDV